MQESSVKSVPLSDAAGALIMVLALRVCFGMRQASSLCFLVVSDMPVKPETNRAPVWCSGSEETMLGNGAVLPFIHPSSVQDVPLCPIHSTSGQAKCGRSWMFFPLNSMLMDHMQCLQTLNTQALCCSISA